MGLDLEKLKKIKPEARQKYINGSIKKAIKYAMNPDSTVESLIWNLRGVYVTALRDRKDPDLEVDSAMSRYKEYYWEELVRYEESITDDERIERFETRIT